MAKYTTQVRSICESKAGLEESKGFNDIDTILNNSWDKIFTTNCTFFDENYRQVLCKKILKHYYTREIGLETVGLWQLFMNRKLEEIMPYYNKLYNSELIQFNPMHTMDMSKTKQITGTEAGTSAEQGNRNVSSNDGGTERETIVDDNVRAGTGSSSETINRDITNQEDINNTTGNVKKDAYSDTPQGSLTNVDNNAYLTNYRRINEDDTFVGNDDTVTNDDTTTSNSSSYREDIDNSRTDTKTFGKNNLTQETNGKQNVNNLTTTENYIESVVGNNGSYNFSRLLQDFRDTFLNIDMLVIGEFKGLFMGLW